MAARTIFTAETPANPNQEDGGQDYTLGTTFVASAGGDCVGIQWYAPSVLPSGDVTVAIYDYGAETLLASKVVVGADAGAWNEIAFDAPVTLVAEAPYIAAFFTPDRYAYTGGFFSGGALVVDDLVAPADGDAPFGSTLRQARFATAGTLAFPTLTSANTCYFVGPVMQSASSVTGVAAASFGFSAVATGVRQVLGQAAASAGFAATAAGRRTVLGLAAASSGFAATASGTRTVRGTAAASFGFTATATGPFDSPAGTGPIYVSSTPTGIYVSQSPGGVQ